MEAGLHPITAPFHHTIDVTLHRLLNTLIVSQRRRRGHGRCGVTHSYSSLGLYRRIGMRLIAHSSVTWTRGALRGGARTPLCATGTAKLRRSRAWRFAVVARLEVVVANRMS